MRAIACRTHVCVTLISVTAVAATTRSVFADCIDDAVVAIGELEATVESTVDSRGLRNGLLRKLHEARGALTDAKSNNDHVAIRKLGDFQDQVDGATPKKISPEDAATLLDGADAIINALLSCGVG